MQIEQLNYFVEVAKTRSVSSAAQNLFVSQPAISMSLKNLEKELNTILFLRTKSGVVLTDTGKLFAAQTKDFLICYEQFEKNTAKMLRQFSQEYHGELVIEAVSNVFYSFLEEVLNNFIKNYKSVTLTIIEKNINTIIKDLLNQECDAGIIVCSETTMNSYPEFEYQSFLTIQEYVLLNRSHPLASKKFLKVNDLLQCSFVVYSFDKKDTTTIDTFFHNIYPDFQPNIALTCSSLSIIKQSISYTDNITFISHLLVDAFTKQSNDLIAIPLLGTPKLKLCGIFLKGNDKVNIINNFFSEFRSYY